MMNVLLWVILGGIAGWIASLLMDNDQEILRNIILGILGAIIGGWLMTQFGGLSISDFNLPSLLVAVLGAVILIWISRLFRRGTKNI